MDKLPLNMINYINILSLIPITTSSTHSLLPYGESSSTLNLKLNKDNRTNSLFPSKIISQLVGHLLGDGSLVISRTSIVPYFVFTQTLKRFEYT
jgi:hypothetical protein